MFVDAFYTIFKFIFQVPGTLIINKLGNRKGLILGNLFVSGAILMEILANGVPILIIAQALMSLGYVLKNLTESNLLYDSIEKSKKRNDLFSRIDGKSSSFYYYVDSITSLTTGFLFVINGYFPMLLCFITCIVSTLLSLKFKEVVMEKTDPVSIRQSLTDIKERM